MRRVAVEVEGDVGAHEAHALMLALGARFRYDLEALEKAAPPEERPPDRRFPELHLAIRKARLDWRRWGEGLVQWVVDLTRRGHSVDEIRPELERGFRAAEVGFLVEFAGPTTPAEWWAQVTSRQAARRVSTVEAAYKAARGRDASQPARVTTEPSIADMVEAARRRPATPRDRGTLDYIRRRAYQYMRRPVENATSEAERLLTDRELQRLREALLRGHADEVNYRDLASDLREAVTGTTLTNDMERVARTELAFAYGYGGYIALKEQAAAQGEADPEVYKMVAPGACEDCRRIWGPPGAPHRYRLSIVEAREAAGGNFRLPRSQWGPVFGPVHPHCTEGPLQWYRSDVVSAITEAAAEMARIYGR